MSERVAAIDRIERQAIMAERTESFGHWFYPVARGARVRRAVPSAGASVWCAYKGCCLEKRIERPMRKRLGMAENPAGAYYQVYLPGLSPEAGFALNSYCVTTFTCTFRHGRYSNG